ncbi:MAG: hypothetical protein IJ601_04290 [Acidaminococcaceae bacterium]|nr:hypothetical protein [Acidaminococcaceae bacterium]
MARTVYDQTMRDHLASIRKIAQTDPWFAVGDAIGSALSGAYANNYNNRGINKAVNKALEEYGAGPNVEGQQAALQQVQQDMAQQPAGVSVGMSDADALNSVRQNYGLGALQPSGPAISAGNVPQQDPQMMAALLGTARAAQPETREQAITRLAQMPGAAIVAQDNAARRLDNFNKAEAMARAQQQMIKDGRTPYQIEQAMAMLEPHFNRMQDDSYRLGVERIAAELGATDENGKRLLSDNEYKQRVVDLATKYGDIGKAAANVYGRDIVSGREQWNAQQQEARENRQFGRQVALNDRRFAQQNARDERRFAQQREENEQNYQRRLATAKARGGSGYGNSITGNTKSPLASEEFKYIASAIKEISEIPEEERTPEQKQFYGTYKPLHDQIVRNSIGGAFGYYGATPQQAGTGTFNPNDYNQAMPKFQALAKSGKYPRQAVESYIRKKYGLNPDDKSNKYVEAIINGIEW